MATQPVSEVSAVEITVEDPGNHTEGGSPTIVHYVYCFLSVSWGDIYPSRRAPLSELWDAAIVRVGFDRGEYLALLRRWGQGMSTYPSCSFCGYGLGLTSCANCGREFKDLLGVRFGWSTPLPPKVVEALKERGHVFGMDPEVGRLRELREYEAH